MTAVLLCNVLDCDQTWVTCERQSLTHVLHPYISIPPLESFISFFPSTTKISSLYSYNFNVEESKTPFANEHSTHSIVEILSHCPTFPDKFLSLPIIDIRFINALFWIPQLDLQNLKCHHQSFLF